MANNILIRYVRGQGYDLFTDTNDLLTIECNDFFEGVRSISPITLEIDQNNQFVRTIVSVDDGDNFNEIPYENVYDEKTFTILIDGVSTNFQIYIEDKDDLEPDILYFGRAAFLEEDYIYFMGKPYEQTIIADVANFEIEIPQNYDAQEGVDATYNGDDLFINEGRTYLVNFNGTKYIVDGITAEEPGYLYMVILELGDGFDAPVCYKIVYKCKDDPSGASSDTDLDNKIYFYFNENEVEAEDKFTFGISVYVPTKVPELVGGSLVSMGEEGSLKETEDTNYGIGINSSDDYIGLPPRAISLFQTTIHPEDSIKVQYDYQGILGTLPPMTYGENGKVSIIYPAYMEGTQGIFTNNMYIGDNKQYIAFYTDEHGDRQLRLVAKSFEILPDDSDLTIDLGDSIVEQKIQYTLSTSDTINTVEEEWSDSPYEESTGFYLWQRTYVKYAKGRIQYLPSEDGYYMAAGQPGPQGPAGQNGEDAVSLIIDSSNGNTFKNNSVSTILTVTIFKGTTIIKNIYDLQQAFGNTAYLQWYWKRMGDATFSELLSTDSMLSNGGFTLTLTPDKVDVKVVFQCEIKTIES